MWAVWVELYISNIKWVSNIVSKENPQQQMLFMYDVGTLGFSGRRCIHLERELLFPISYN